MLKLLHKRLQLAHGVTQAKEQTQLATAIVCAQAAAGASIHKQTHQRTNRPSDAWRRALH